MCKSAYMYVCSPLPCPGTHGGQKRAFDPLELELGLAVNHHVCARTRLRSSARAQQVLLTTEPALQLQVLLFYQCGCVPVLIHSHRNQNWGVGALELKLNAFVSHPLCVLGSRLSSVKSSALNCCTISSAPQGYALHRLSHFLSSVLLIILISCICL